MSRQQQQYIHTTHESFICSHCGRAVTPTANGTSNRNHCPYCLYSRHMDIRPGDRRSGCRGLMEPIGIWVQRNKEWSIIHRCTACGFIRTNRIAGDDDENTLLRLAAHPLSALPFPMRLGQESTV
nr:RNHCP domain-containing protein [Spirochaeta lutea]